MTLWNRIRAACTKTGCTCQCNYGGTSCKFNTGHCCICSMGCHLGHN